MIRQERTRVTLASCPFIRRRPVGRASHCRAPVPASLAGGAGAARREAGQELVEFALILPLLLLLFLGIIEFGRAILAYNTIANAAREGARYGIVDPNHGRDPDQQLSSSPAVRLAASPGGQRCPQFDIRRHRASCGVMYDFQPVDRRLHWAALATIPLHTQATMQREQ